MAAHEELAFHVNQVRVTDSEIQLQVRSVSGHKLEVGLAFSVHPFTGKLEMNPVRHFGDPESDPWFDDSMAWDDWFAGIGIRKPVQ